MLQYDANTDGFAKLGDRVKVVRSGGTTDGLTGTIGGWGDYSKYIALVALDAPMDDGRTIVGWPVVCLKPTSIIDELVKVQKKTFLETFELIIDDDQSTKKPSDNLCSESVAIDTDGFIVWEGGADRPVDEDTLIQVRLRGGTVREQRDAKYWYQAHWRHWPEDHPMNNWDIVAYKVVK